MDGERGDLAELSDDAMNAIGIALRLKGYTAKDIAIALDVPLTQVRRVLRNGRVNGKLRDVVNDLQASALPLAVEGLIESLERGERWAISETLRGLGAFKTHTAQQIDAKTESTELSVTFVQPHAPMVMNPNGIVGRARGLEVIDAPVHALQETGGQEVRQETLPAREGGTARDQARDATAHATIVGGRLALPTAPTNGVDHAQSA